jgi:cytochrome c-type biogenesis protein CcmH/NrfG
LDLDFKTLSNVDVNGLYKSRNELEEMLFSNADFASGRMQLGDYYLQTNDLNNAIKHYKMAIKMDSLLIPVYSNLATSYNLNGETEQSLNILNILIDKDPELGRSYYLRALLYFELNQDSNALKDLNKAISLEPLNSRYLYNLATYQYQNRKFAEGGITIKKALKLEAQNQDYKYLLALIYQEQGNVVAYQKIMQELNVNQ